MLGSSREGGQASGPPGMDSSSQAGACRETPAPSHLPWWGAIQTLLPLRGPLAGARGELKTRASARWGKGGGGVREREQVMQFPNESRDKAIT